MKEFLEDAQAGRAKALEIAQKEGLTPEEAAQRTRVFDMTTDIMSKLNKQRTGG